MKKLFITALLAISVAASAFAKDEKNVNAAIMQQFNVEFKNAANVSWTATEEFTKATFIMNSQKMEAFYNTNAELIATSKGISIDELPVAAKRSFAKQFGGYTVKEAISVQGSEESAYFISAENDQESVILKVNEHSQLSTFKKTKK